MSNPRCSPNWSASAVGSVYLGAYKDKDGDWFDGARSYRLRVPPNAPVEQFWSLTIYDVSTHTLIANKEQVADRSSRMQLVKNADGSVDLYVGPKAPSGRCDAGPTVKRRAQRRSRARAGCRDAGSRTAPRIDP
jgi:hypothetical protein